MKVIQPPFLLLLILVLTGDFLHAQNTSADNEEIISVINTLFDGMREGDSTKVKSVFHYEARLCSVSSKGEVTEISGNEFAAIVGKPHKEIWDERTFDLDIQTEGVVASVWCKYAFYLDEKFSHCGIDAFQLVKNDQGWKIIQITDTRNKENCEEHKSKTRK